MSNRTTLLFIILACIYCLATFIEPYSYNWLIKILPILVLIFITLLNVIVKATLPKLANNQTSNQNGKSVTMLLVALLFSICGDILLAMQGQQFFIFGSASFLIAYLFFTISFKPFIKQNLVYIPIYIVTGVTLFSLVANNLNELFIPVLAGMLVLLTMAVGTLLSSKSNQWMIIGGIFFVASNALIGIDTFYLHIPYSHLWIMFTYYTAQYCLVNSVLLATNVNAKKR